VFPPDEAEPDAGPADNKPTTNLSAEPVPPETAAPGQPASAPGQLASAPGPFAVRPSSIGFHAARAGCRVRCVRSGTGAGVVVVEWPASLLVVLAVVLFAAAAGGGFVQRWVLAGRPLLPPVARQFGPPAQRAAGAAGEVPSPRWPRRAAVTPGTPGGNFSVSVPVGWTKFVEQRGKQTLLPDSTGVRWVKSDGLAELTVGTVPRGQLV